MKTVSADIALGFDESQHERDEHGRFTSGGGGGGGGGGGAPSGKKSLVENANKRAGSEVNVRQSLAKVISGQQSLMSGDRESQRTMGAIKKAVVTGTRISGEDAKLVGDLFDSLSSHLDSDEDEDVLDKVRSKIVSGKSNFTSREAAVFNNVLKAMK